MVCARLLAALAAAAAASAPGSAQQSELPGQQQPGAPVAQRQGGRESRGQEPGPRSREVAGEPGAGVGSILDGAHATGDWGGWRTELERLGITPAAFSITDGSWVAAGGADRYGTALRSLFDLTVSFDGERLWGVADSELFVDLQVQRGTTIADDAGVLQGVSNIDAESRTQIAKLWYAQELFDRHLRVKVGKADANSDFAYVENGYRLIHPSFGFSPTILGMPSYPDPSFGLNVFVRADGGFYAGGGVYDGAGHTGVSTGRRGPSTVWGSPDDLFLIAEAGRRWGGGDEGLAGRLGVGAFRHTGAFARFDGGSEDGTDGLFAVLDQTLYSPTPGGERSVGMFVRYGCADADTSAIDRHLGAGFTWNGPLALRPDDALAFGVSHGSLSRASGAAFVGDAEVAYELCYTLHLSPWLRIKPDVQWIDDPGGRAGVGDALVFTLRVSIDF